MELLVSVVLVAVCVGMVVSAAGSVSAKKSDIACASNLRQIGSGIMAYTLDHNDKLPGPVYTGVYPWWNDPAQLSWHIADYLELQKRRKKDRGRLDVFVCPGYAKAVKQIGDAPVYTLNIEVHLGGEDRPLPPFGYPNSLHNVVFKTDSDYMPMKSVRLADIVDEEGRPARSTTWMLMDADQLDPRFARYQAANISSLPAARVHGAHRNTLFFDFHVGRTGLDYLPH